MEKIQSISINCSKYFSFQYLFYIEYFEVKLLWYTGQGSECLLSPSVPVNSGGCCMLLPSFFFFIIQVKRIDPISLIHLPLYLISLNVTNPQKLSVSCPTCYLLSQGLPKGFLSEIFRKKRGRQGGRDGRNIYIHFQIISSFNHKYQTQIFENTSSGLVYYILY